MKVSLITPAAKHSRSGNRASAMRWAGILRRLGHKVRVASDYSGGATDLMIALHAWRSAGAIAHYRRIYPQGPLVVALGGTDVNTFLETKPETTIRSMIMADALVCLHDLIGELLPAKCADKLFVIRQSAWPLPVPRKPSVRHFDVCVVGHLREEKDPFRAAKAARLAPAASLLRVIHMGRAHTEQWAQRARREMARNPRYLWRGEVPRWRVRRQFVSSRLMVISSLQEGGANVVSEAVAAGLPIIASDISGNVGLLGADYPGYYPVGNEQALAALLQRAEREPRYLRLLETRTRELAPLFTPEREAAGWEQVIASVMDSK
ncbi:MAG: selenoneine biosynthesis selenosugar synthase SenB [Gammaproteobacteria bacterium]